jgi:hypothetical protein
VRAVAGAYVQFAVDHPALFGLMFGAGRGGREPEVERSAAAAFEVLLGAVRAAQEQGEFAAGAPRELALTAWAAIHGLAALASGGLASLKGFDLAPRRLAERVDHVLFEGLRPR